MKGTSPQRLTRENNECGQSGSNAILVLLILFLIFLQLSSKPGVAQQVIK